MQVTVLEMSKEMTTSSAYLLNFPEYHKSDEVDK